MKVNSISAYANFKGYSNVIGTGTVMNDGSYLQFISAILDDEGEKDLTNFNRLQKMNNDLPDNCLIFFRCVDAKGREGAFVNDIALYSGDELIKLENRIGKDVTEGEFMQIQGVQMKAYTLLANLMKRLRNENKPQILDDVNTIMKKSTKKLLKYTDNINLSSYVVLSARDGSVPFQMVSQHIYESIMQNMEKFFKVKIL